ncbi:hypothetical protein SCUP515_08316 [Seiridium cupressi]
MLKSISTWVLVASAALAIAEPISLDARDLAEPMPLEAREMETREVEARTVRNGLATFDTDNISAGIAAVKELGYYGGVYYQGIDAVALGVNGKVVAGVKPASEPNVAAFGITTQVLRSKAAIRSNFTGSVTKSFSLKSLYFGCAVGTVESVASVAISCKFALAGYDAQSNLLAYQAFNFSPDKGLTSNMIKATFNSDFQDLVYVRLAATYGGLNILGATLIDNITYTITV